MLLRQNGKERLLLHDVLEDESCISHGFIIFLAVQLLNKRSDDKLLLLGNFGLKFIIKV